MNAVEIDGLTYTYPGAPQPTLRDISLQIPKGDFLAVVGNNGCGKSTLCKALNGLIPHFITGSMEGSVRVEGLDTRESDVGVLAQKVGYVYQDFENQIVRPTVLDDASYACLNYAFPDYLARGRTALRQCGLEGREEEYVWQLSGGQTHLLALAGAVSLQPDILILDEPIAQLDPMHADRIYAVLRDLNENHGKTISTQNNPFFVTLAEGAKAAAQQLGVSLSVADAGDDVAKQVSDIEDLVSSNISILIVNPVDSDGVTGAVQAAMAKGVRVISVDRAVNGVDIDCQIASDNVMGAEMATQYIVDTLGEGIKVAELEGTPGASAAIDRSEGFHNIADEKLDVVVSQTANFDRTEGMSVMENMLQAHGDIQAVFAANDEMALGAVEAVSGAGKDILVVGFDATDDAIDAIKAGRMAATIAQQPALIGSTAVENAVKLINGESIPSSIPVEVTLITIDNA